VAPAQVVATVTHYDVTITYVQPLPDGEPSCEITLRSSRHRAQVWETVSGWVWSCKRCEARNVQLTSMADALQGAIRHMAREVPWWRKVLGQ